MNDKPKSSLGEDIAALEACLESASTPRTEALAEALAGRLSPVGPADAPEMRELAVKGYLVANHQFYRTGELPRCGEMLRRALALADGLGVERRMEVLLRCGDFDMLRWDVGRALEHTAAAFDLAHVSGRRVEQARALVNYGMA